jgi:hypothetical protein
MNSIFHDKLDEFDVIIYIDVILFYFVLAEEHIKHLKYMFNKSLKIVNFMWITPKASLWVWRWIFWDMCCF